MSHEKTIAPTTAAGREAKRALEQMVYHAVMEFAPWPMAEVEGTAHMVRAVNPSFCTLLEKTEAELLGRPIAELFIEGHATRGLLDRVQLSGEAATHVETASNTPGPIYWSYTCWPVQAKDARHVGLMIQVTETSKDDQQTKDMNEALLISSVKQHELTEVADRLNVQLVKEMAEHERAEKLLRQNHDTFFNLIENAPFGVYVIDSQFRLRQASSASLKVFSNVVPLMDRDFEEILRSIWPEPFANDAIGRFRHTLSTGEPYTAKDSTEQRLDIPGVESYDWKIERIILPDGQFGVVCYFYDISEQKLIEETLRESDRNKTEFLATLAHELRNPLSPLVSGLEILALPNCGPETAERTHVMMSRQLQHMVRLIDDLMDLSRVSRGVINIRKERMDLRPILTQAAETVRAMYDTQGHTLSIHLPEEALAVQGDANRLLQVFGNLLTNAAKFTDPGGTITVRAQQTGEEVAVSVEDNGIGIAQEQLATVFDMFAQVDRSMQRAQGGLGIGLNIVKHMVTLHGGRIEVLSAGLGTGTRFTVFLPRAAALATPATTATTATPQAAAPLAFVAHRILVVDDNEDAVNLIAHMLTRAGHTVQVAYSGLQALEFGARMLPTVVLMDIGMPGMDGNATCSSMRLTPWGQAAFIAALTGWGNADDKHRTEQAGFDHHLVKPIGRADLAALLVTVG